MTNPAIIAAINAQDINAIVARDKAVDTLSAIGQNGPKFAVDGADNGITTSANTTGFQLPEDPLGTSK